MHTHTLSLFPHTFHHTLTHSRACALMQPPWSLAGNNPTLTRGLSCTGGTELLPCTSVSSKCGSCRRGCVCECESVRMCAFLFLPENAEALSLAEGDPL